MLGTAFWSHTIWFILLGITTMIELIIILLNVKKRPTVLALYLTISGMTFFFEMIILSLLRAYTYYPMLIPDSPPDDSIAGNLFSQFSVSASALLLAVFHLKYYWYIVFALIYGSIEELFLALGLYKQNWYHTWMTVLFLLFFFLGSEAGLSPMFYSTEGVVTICVYFPRTVDAAPKYDCLGSEINGYSKIQ